jgi:hypothetical protein
MVLKSLKTCPRMHFSLSILPWQVWKFPRIFIEIFIGIAHRVYEECKARFEMRLHSEEDCELYIKRTGLFILLLSPNVFDNAFCVEGEFQVMRYH